VPNVVGPLHIGSCVELNKLPYLYGVTLAHPITGGKPFKISLLIGVDHYWTLVGDHVIRGDGTIKTWVSFVWSITHFKL